jgi:hypothetical protein
MEPNQTNPSPDNSGIPQGIPTGVFVPNNQTPTVQAAPVKTPTVSPTSPAQSTEGPLDKFLR